MEEDFSELSFQKESILTKSFPVIYIVRHAESIANSQGIYQGQSYDTDLSELGIKQAERLAKRSQELGIKKIISSPLRRCYQTALAVSKSIDCPICVDQRIVEINHGVWEGKHKDWIKENYPDLYDIWRNKPHEVLFPDGEALADVWNRIDDLLDDNLLEDGTMMITHDAVIRVIKCMSESIDKFWEQKLDSASLNFFEMGIIDGKRRLRPLKMNEANHLKNLRGHLAKHAL